MRYLKLTYLLVGVVLLFVVLREVDITEVWFHTQHLGVGLIVILLLYMVVFVADSYSWQLTLPKVPLNLLWLYRVWKVRMVGDVFNTVMPGATVAGEPLKAMLLNKHFAVHYHEGVASVVLARTINLFGLIPFLIVGFGFMLSSSLMPNSYKLVAGIGLLILTAATGAFFAVQRLRLFTITGAWVSQRRLARRLKSVLEHIREVDERFVLFYSQHRRRFVAAVVVAFIAWVIGAFEIYYMMIFLEHPIPFAQAWMIEAIAQMVRAGTFLIPASIGAQEGAFMLVYTVITGSPALGIAVAMIRRFREVLWLVWGALLGLGFSVKSRTNKT